MNFFSYIRLLFIPVILFYGCTGKRNALPVSETVGNLRIGWSSVDITPDKPVLLAGQFHARVSEGVHDPVTATALAVENGDGRVIMISCDLVSIGNDLRDTVRALLKTAIPELRSDEILLNATHTHTAPSIGLRTNIKEMTGVDLEALTPAECLEFISKLIAKAGEEAWKNRKPGGISYGIGQAVVGHNRITTDINGKSVMYKNAGFREFSNVEGSNDHSVNLMYTFDDKRSLTGIVINVACPSQVTEALFEVSADYWYDTRQEVRKRMGRDIYILPQCSAAGDQSPHLQMNVMAEARMQRLIVRDSIRSGRSSMAQRRQIGLRIATAVEDVYQYVKDSIDWNPAVKHHAEIAELTRRERIIVDRSSPEAFRKLTGLVSSMTPEDYEKEYNRLIKAVEENPDLKKDRHWYVKITDYYAKMRRNDYGKDKRGENEKVPVEINVVRIGDIVFASNPFELYLDYGDRIKSRSPFIQTFVVQLANGGAGYLPTKRSVEGGSYGAANTRVGPAGGQELVEKTLEIINSIK